MKKTPEAATHNDREPDIVTIWALGGDEVAALRCHDLTPLFEATTLLTRYLKADRVPVVVRRPIGDGPSLVELALRDPRAAAEACRAMFDFSSLEGELDP